MTPKEKAIELHDKYYRVFERLGLDDLPSKYAKEQATICIEELLYFSNTQANGLQTGNSVRVDWIEYFNKVKYELSLL